MIPRGGLGEIISPSVPLLPKRTPPPSKSPAKSKKSMTPPYLQPHISSCRINLSGKSTNQPRYQPFLI